METSRALRPENRLADGAQRLGEGLARMMRRHEGKFVMQLGHLAVIALQESRQGAGHESGAYPASSRPMMPKSTCRQPPLIVDEQICRDACRHGKSRRAAPG
jgi:hypothetical protein